MKVGILFLSTVIILVVSAWAVWEGFLSEPNAGPDAQTSSSPAGDVTKPHRGRPTAKLEALSDGGPDSDSDSSSEGREADQIPSDRLEDERSNPTADDRIDMLFARYGSEEVHLAETDATSYGASVRRYAKDFAEQTRRESWAAPIEDAITHGLQGTSFAVNFDDEVVECRSRTCMISASVDAHVFDAQQTLSSGTWLSMMAETRRAASRDYKFYDEGVDVIMRDPATNRVYVTTFWEVQQ